MVVKCPKSSERNQLMTEYEQLERERLLAILERKNQVENELRQMRLSRTAGGNADMNSLNVDIISAYARRSVIIDDVGNNNEVNRVHYLGFEVVTTSGMEEDKL